MMKKLLAIAFVLVLTPMASIAVEFKEGTHYTVFNQGPVTGQPTVTEFFSFFCGHCNSFEKNSLPIIKAGLDEGVKLEQYHVDFLGGEVMGQEMTRALAIAKVLKVEDTIKPAMFSAIHDAKRTFATSKDVRQLFLDNGVVAEDFDKASSSFLVNSMMKKWRAAQTQSQIRGVPAMMVNNKYLVDFGSIKSYKELTDLLNYLALKG